MLCAAAVLAAAGVWTLIARSLGLYAGYAVPYGVCVGISARAAFGPTFEAGSHFALLKPRASASEVLVFVVVGAVTAAGSFMAVSTDKVTHTGRWIPLHVVGGLIQTSVNVFVTAVAIFQAHKNERRALFINQAAILFCHFLA